MNLKVSLGVEGGGGGGGKEGCALVFFDGRPQAWYFWWQPSSLIWLYEAAHSLDFHPFAQPTKSDEIWRLYESFQFSKKHAHGLPKIVERCEEGIRYNVQGETTYVTDIRLADTRNSLPALVGSDTTLAPHSLILAAVWAPNEPAADSKDTKAAPRPFLCSVISCWREIANQPSSGGPPLENISWECTDICIGMSAKKIYVNIVTLVATSIASCVLASMIETIFHF